MSTLIQNTATVVEYKLNDPIDETNKVNAFRVIFNEGNETPTTLDDTAIMKVLEKFVDRDLNDDDVQVEIVGALEEAELNGDKPLTPEEAIKQNEQTINRLNENARLIFKLAVESADKTDDKFAEVAEAALVADETKVATPVMLCEQLIRIHGNDLYLMPMPGSKEDDVKKSNRPWCYDRYRRSKKDKNGGESLRPASYWGDYAERSSEGKRISAIADAISAAQAKNWSFPGAKEFEKKAPRTLSVLLKRQDHRMKGLTSKLQRAFKLAVMQYRVNELEHVFWEYVSDDETDERLTTKSPIRIVNKHKPRDQWYDMTVTEFLSLNPTAAASRGGTYEALRQTIGGDKTGGASGGSNSDNPATITDKVLELIGSAGANVPMPRTLAQYESFLAQVLNYGQTSDGYEAIVKFIASDKSDDFLLTLDAAAEFFDGLRGKAIKRIELALTKRAAMKEQAAADELAKIEADKKKKTA